MRDRTRGVAALVLPILLLLACAPSFSGEGALEIRPSWQCPTPSVEPTRLIGDGPTPPPPPEATYVPGQEPTGEPIFSTPMPTATPYIRGAGDYFQGQRISVGSVLVISVTGHRSQPGPTPDTAYHLIDLRIENISTENLAILFDLSLLRSIKRLDGRIVQDGWFHDDAAARHLGISPAHDPEFDEDPNGGFTGGYPPGVTERTLVYVAPAGEAQSWGMNFRDTDTHRDQTAGDGQIWVILRQDPHCTDPGGAAGDPGNIPPAGSPSVGSGAWPVPQSAVITRGYGCASFYTGVHGNCGGATPWWHDGIDFAAPVGTPLFATTAMTILYAGVDTSTMDCSWLAPQNDPPYHGFGQFVKAQDANSYTYWYGHLTRWRVQTGQQVARGTQVGDMGKTGCSTGSHLHFRVRLNGLDRNPMEVISR